MEKIRIAQGGNGLWLAIFEFYIMAGLVHLISMAIPDMKISKSQLDTSWKNEDPRNLWRRGSSYDSDWISFSNFFSYTLLNAGGFIFVQLVLHKRRKPWLGHDGNRFDLFVTVLMLSPLLFFTSVLVTWRSRHAIDELSCTTEEIEELSC